MLLKIFVFISVCACSNAYTEHHGGGGHSLQTIPDIESYGKIQFPHFDIIDLGSYQKGDLPPKIIHITKKIVIKQPKPYPVKVPHPVPYPVPHKVPYPVIQKEIVKVPEPVPYPVTKTVEVPIEVPKPYPVPVHEYNQGGNGGQSGSGQDYSQYDQNQSHENENSYSKQSISYGVPGQAQGKPLSLEEHLSQNQQIDYQVFHGGQGDQTVNYAAVQVPIQDVYQGREDRPVHEEHQETEKQ